MCIRDSSPKLVYEVAYAVWSTASIFLSLLIPFLLVEVAIGSFSMKLVGQAVWNDKVTLGWAIMTLLACTYMFSAVSMAFFQGDYSFPDVTWSDGSYPGACETLLSCARDHLQYGLHSPPIWDAPTDLGQWIFDMLYFFFVTLFLTEMITAFLFDTFFKVKDKFHRMEDLGTNSRCFICSEDPETLRRLYPDLEEENDDATVLKRHCNNTHDLFSWAGFYAGIQLTFSRHRQHAWGISSERVTSDSDESNQPACSNLPGLLGEERWLALMIEARRSEVCPIYKKDSSLDSWRMAPFNTSTSEDIRILHDQLSDQLQTLGSQLNSGSPASDGTRSTVMTPHQHRDTI
eukprot:TRINITY_DN51550_c0_g1_i1.p1 TRINITY_DN51550_c0_g1~~TRINITY_DN51550_c0_g1_i1.p1  ORF type:complete len:346 (+),score=47.06 TRINITY_DN51550_c0_g1_i1:174-1211(+)